MKLDGSDLANILKLNQLVLDANVKIKLCNVVENKINIQNVLTYHQLAKLFKLSGVSKTTFSYIERNFTMIVETESFLELDCMHTLEILRSSELLITSELEVYDSAVR